MSFYHWFPSHPNECEFSGDVHKLHDIGQQLRVIGARQARRPPQTDFQRISSVPDVWSQHRLFDMLLLNDTLDPSYVEYESIAKREWRAILTIVVLAESFGVVLHTKTIEFDDEKVKNAYIRAAYDMRPNGERWRSMEVYYIESNHQQYPIAMTSPTVHLVPAKDAWDNLRMVYSERIPFITKDMVHAPIVPRGKGFAPLKFGEKEDEQVFAMLPVHALMLKEWLAMYREKAAAGQNTQIIEDYEDALNAAYQLDAESMPSVKSFFATDTQYKGTKLHNIDTPMKLQIFLDRIFCAKIEPKSDSSAIPDTNRYAGGISTQNIFFQQKENGEYSHYFIPMPVTEMFWKFWLDNINCGPSYSIDCEVSENGRLTKTVVTVSVGAIRFSEVYLKSRIKEGEWQDLCTAGIWPRQKIAGWSENFLFCYEANGYRVEPLKTEQAFFEKSYTRPDKTGGSIRYYKLNHAPECCALLENHDVIGYFLIREREEIRSGVDTNIYRASIDFGTSSTTLYGGVFGNEAKKLTGINLWSLPLINTLNDIGEEYCQLERFFVPPLPKAIERIAADQQPDTRKPKSFADLKNDPESASRYPSCVPMQTILAEFTNINTARNYLRDCWIYFRNFTLKRGAESWPKAYADLKWAHASPADQHRIRAILAQMLVMLALEARSSGCGKIAITATYPLSFEETARSSYYNALNDMFQAVCKVTGLQTHLPALGDEDTGDPAQDSMLINSLTESEAVFRFTTSQDPDAENYFVVDIGGGSTDVFISLTDRNQHRNSYSTSFGFGARKVLLEKLRHDNKRILRLLMDRSDDGIEQYISDKTAYLSDIPDTNFTDKEAETKGNSKIEDLFAIRVPFDPQHLAALQMPEDFGEAFLRYCAETRGDILMIELKKRIAFYLGASIWLSGMMLREEQNPNLNVTLLFAGNGSKMIRWLDSDLNRTKYFIYQLFQKTVGIQIREGDFGCLFSAMPKEEVAHGALLPLPDGFYDLRRSNAKQIFFDRRNEEIGSVRTYHSLCYSREDIKTDRAEFEAFLRAFRECAIASFEWRFADGEYDVPLLDKKRLDNVIQRKQNEKGYFLSAIEAVGRHYLGATSNRLTD